MGAFDGLGFGIAGRFAGFLGAGVDDFRKTEGEGNWTSMRSPRRAQTWIEGETLSQQSKEGWEKFVWVVGFAAWRGVEGSGE